MKSLVRVLRKILESPRLSTMPKAGFDVLLRSTARLLTCAAGAFVVDEQRRHGLRRQVGHREIANSHHEDGIDDQRQPECFFSFMLPPVSVSVFRCAGLTRPNPHKVWYSHWNANAGYGAATLKTFEIRAFSVN